MPLLDTAKLKQTDGHSCGLVGFDILHRYHYNRPTPDWTHEIPNPVQGTRPDTMESLIRRHFGCIAIGHWDILRLGLFAKFTPVLCVIIIDDEEDHWVAVRGVTQSRVYYQCPLEGRKSRSHVQWMNIWRDASDEGPYPRFAITGWPI